MDWDKAEEKLNFLSRLPGDKVVWIIVTLLSMISLVCVFSASSEMVDADNSRFDIMGKQFFTMALGGFLIYLCFKVRRIKVFKFFSLFGFVVPFLMLAIVVTGANLGIVKGGEINHVRRVICVGGFQIHVYEVTKVAMVMYLAWAVDTFKKDGFVLLPMLARFRRLEFLDKPIWKEIVYIFLPITVITVMILAGGASSAMFTAAIMVLTILIGGIDFKHVCLLGVCGILVLGACTGLYMMTKGSEKPLFERIGVVIGRFSRGGDDGDTSDMGKFMAAAPGSADYYKALDQIRQPRGARLAVKEGGIIGKGPGQSTQKYVVAVMCEDYMFSFIVEEYGIVGAILVLMLYVSLLARGSLIARNCQNNFAKIAVAGLCLLISGQAMFHILVNLDCGILTGQTLPLVSYGTSSFLCFAVAFGIILSISRMTEEKIQAIQESETPLVPEDLQSPEDEVKDNLSDLSDFESGVEFTDNDIL